jgi:hypothetical protein
VRCLFPKVLRAVGAECSSDPRPSQPLTTCALQPRGTKVTDGSSHNRPQAGHKPTAIIKYVPVFWDTASCSPYVNRRFGGNYYLHLRDRKSAEEETGPQQVAEQLFRNVGSHMD